VLKRVMSALVQSFSTPNSRFEDVQYRLSTAENVVLVNDGDNKNYRSWIIA